jgi:hypothetical protein
MEPVADLNAQPDFQMIRPERFFEAGHAILAPVDHEEPCLAFRLQYRRGGLRAFFLSRFSF